MTDAPQCPLHGLPMVDAGLSDDNPDERPRQRYRCQRDHCGIEITRPAEPPTANLQLKIDPKE